VLLLRGEADEMRQTLVQAPVLRRGEAAAAREAITDALSVWPRRPIWRETAMVSLCREACVGDEDQTG